MKQRALTFGVLANPYRTIEPGQEFDYPTPLKWAEPVDEPESGKGRRKRSEPVEPDPADPADPI